MHLVYSLEEPPDFNLPSIFLAGPTPRQRSRIRSWRPRAIKILEQTGFNGIVFDPENRRRLDKIDHEKQPKWEHRMLHRSSCILFWIPRDLKKLPGFTTNVEFGLFAKSGKINLGAPKHARKIEYLRFVAQKFSISQYWTLEETVRTSVRMARYLHGLNQKVHINQQHLYCPFCASRLGTRTEEGRERKYCVDCGWTYYPKPDVAVAAVITKINDGSNPCVLMVRRKREPFTGTWMFPAGFLEQGEHPEKDTLPREVMEETGLTLINFLLIQILKSTSDPRSPDHLVLFYHVQITGDIINNDPNENSDIRWISVEDGVDIGFPHHRIIFDQIKSSQRQMITLTVI